ncbi:MAG: radical SAM protein [Dehalococcoidia bacterium]|nr:MAG: radical SAM protein [Dehalococcoidia bacterium]
MSKELNPLDEFYFQWHITERCNKHCQHCYQNGKPKNDLPISGLEQILDHIQVSLIKWDKQGSLSFTGGEPLIRRSELFALMNRVDQMSEFAYYDILTNGSLISDDVVQELKLLHKLRRVQVSLEGSSPEINDSIRGKGSYAETLDAIRKMKRQGLTVSVMATISHRNFQDIPALIEVLNDEGVDTFAMERLIPEGNGKSLSDQLLSPEELHRLYEQVYEIALQKKTPRILMYRPLFNLVAPDDESIGALCSIGNNALTIMPDGTVYPCRRLPIPIGNILTDGLFSIWYDSEVLWQIRNPDNIQGKCHDCDYLASCRGCRAMAYFCSGNYLAEDPQCWR